MPSRSSVPKRPWRGPRSQEERSAATRAKVVTAATECLAELGLRAATLAAIADRAGVTCGAIQHQFGEKEALLDAVLEAAIEELRTHFSRVRASTPDPVGRVRALMARCREVLAGPLYRAFFEIQLSRRRESGKQTEAWSDYIDGELAGLERTLRRPRAVRAAARGRPAVPVRGAERHRGRRNALPVQGVRESRRRDPRKDLAATPGAGPVKGAEGEGA